MRRTPIKWNWKGPLGGALQMTGTSMMAAAVLDWMSPGEQWWVIRLGFALMIIGQFWTSIVSRDKNISDQDAGLRPDLNGRKPTE